MHGTLIVNLKILLRSLWPHVFTIFIFYEDGDGRVCVCVFAHLIFVLYWFRLRIVAYVS